MELQYVVMTIIKILISVPTLVVVIQFNGVNGAALIGGHVNNVHATQPAALSKSNITEFKIDLSDDNVQEESVATEVVVDDGSNRTETVPDPEPLIVPGYNLPDNIFNKGKPFYLEKDPLTGNIDFNSKSKLYEEYDYEDVDYDKAAIDRKDGPIAGGGGHHKPSDINQLTPNFHDFLNLPVKYNPDKYVYPLISSSYANTKVQGNVNKHQNHKNYVVTTYKPTLSPTYFTTKYYHTQDKVIEYTAPSKYAYDMYTTPTPVKMQTTKRVTENNLMSSPMNHPSYAYKEDYYHKPSTMTASSTRAPATTTTSSTTTVRTTTKRQMSLFEQLFGSDYDDTEMTEASPTTTMSSSTMAAITSTTPIPAKTVKPFSSTDGQHIQLFHNLPKKASTASVSTTNHQNVLTGSHMGDMNFSYEYEDEKPAHVSEVVKKPPPPPPSLPPQHKEPENIESEEYDYDYLDKTTAPALTSPKDIKQVTSSPPASSTVVSTTTPPTYASSASSTLQTTTTEATKMTSLPLGENHIQHHHHHQQQANNRPIIVTGPNLREQLNNEKVGYVHHQAPSTSSIHIAPDQDTVSFVMGNHQNVDGAATGSGGSASSTAGTYVGTSLKESPYESNPFRPVYDQQPDEYQVKNEYQKPYFNNAPVHHPGNAVTIQPIKTSEASLSIGSQIPLKPGHVVDEKIEEVDYTKGAQIVFPDAVDKSTTYTPDLSPPPPPSAGNTYVHNLHPGALPPGAGHKEVLKLSSKPMFHQLPSELMPPESVVKLPQRVRPPWDPRPGHFHAGRPEYARPPRPQEVYKRVDTLPNILPQFRPNMGNNKPVHHNHPHGHHPHYQHQHQHQQNKHAPQSQPQNGQNYARQPLLERPLNNRPIGFFEKLHPPPPPPPGSGSAAQSKIPSKVVEDRIGAKPPQKPQQQQQQSQNGQNLPPMQEHFAFLQAPPKIMVPNRRNGEDPETLQMIQAKQEKKTDKQPVFKPKAPLKDNTIGSDISEIVTPKSPSYVNTDKPLYVVYPVNSAPMKLDALNAINNKKETVVIGTRAELPLPPSKIKPTAGSSAPSAGDSDFKYELKDRHDSPILKPRPAIFPIKSDFPYPLERPDPSMVLAGDVENKLPDEPTIISSNQWNTIEQVDTEPRIVNHNQHAQPANGNQISVTLKTYTEKPIAVAYTPTDSSKFSMPNYASLVIPEIRDSEITVSAVMHHGPAVSPPLAAHVHHHVLPPQQQQHQQPQRKHQPLAPIVVVGSGGDDEQQEFQAPFQASAHIDHSLSQGWAVVREKDERKDEITTQPILTTSEFDIENFKPQLEGGFKPIYSYPDDGQDGGGKEANKEVVISERQE